MPGCDTCKEFLYEGERHKCPPALEVIDLDELESFEQFGEPDEEAPEWTTVYARDAAEASEKFARKRFEYEGSIRVRVRNQHGVTIDLRVTAEYELRFDASADGEFRDPTRWERDRIANSREFATRTEPVAVAAAA